MAIDPELLKQIMSQSQAQEDPQLQYIEAKKQASKGTVGGGAGTLSKTNTGVNSGVSGPAPALPPLATGAVAGAAPTGSLPALPSLATGAVSGGASTGSLPPSPSLGTGAVAGGASTGSLPPLPALATGAVAGGAPTGSLPALPSPSTDTDTEKQLNPEALAQTQRALEADTHRIPGVDNLWNKAKDIQNPVLRPIGEVGAGTLKALAGIGGALAGPTGGFMNAIPGTKQNLSMKEQQDINRQKELLGLESTNAETGLKNAQADYYGNEKGANKTIELINPEDHKTHTWSTNKDGNPVKDLGITGNAALNKPEEPKFMKDDKGNIIELKPDGAGGTTNSVAYADPNPKKDVGFITRDVGTVPHVFMVDKQTGEQKDMGVHYERPNNAGTTFYLPQPDGSYLASKTPGPGALTAAGVNSASTPTTAQKTRSAVASDTFKNIKGILDNIEENKSKLGPVNGRINSFALKYGFSHDADLANLSSQIELLKTAVGMIHYGVRGGPEDFRKMQDAFYSLAQDPATLKAHIAGAVEYLHSYLNDKDAQKLGENDPYNKIPPELMGSSAHKGMPARPAGAPSNYVYDKHGAKGPGYYPPAAQ